MNLKGKLYILSLVSKIMAAQFSVVSFVGDCQLSVNGATHAMTKHSKCPNLFEASVDVPLNTKYKYICGGVEDVERVLKDKTTHNELFGRALTVYDMPEFSYPDSKPWSRSIGRTELFDPTYVPIVIIDGDRERFVDPHDSVYNSVTFILKDNVFVFNDVRSSTKNYDEDKFQIRMSLKGDDNIYNRRVFKLRPSAYDPAFIRQILYGDIAHAVGNPAHESVSARVYLKDGTGVGLYVLQEDVTTESFIRSAFYGNSDGSIKKFKLSPIYDCSTGADFNPDDPHHLSAFQNLSDPNDLRIELKGMMKKLVGIDVTNKEHIKNIDENWLDIESLLKAMALEYLAGHWDSYWFLTSNFVTYHTAEETSGTKDNYSKYKYYFIDQDFDQTWSVGMSSGFDPEVFPTKKYTEFVNKDPEFWREVTGEDYDSGTRVIINKLIGCDGLSTCPTKELFEKHLKSIVKHIFNPVALGRKVDGYKERLDEEVKWDTSLAKIHEGTDKSYNFTYDDFIDGMEVGVSSPYGIMDWTKVIADTVCKQFNMDYDHNPSIPEAPHVSKPSKYPTVTAIIATTTTTTTTTTISQPTLIDNQNGTPINGTIENNGLDSNSPNPGVENVIPLQNTNSESSSAIITSKISTILTLFTIILSFILYF